jgi:hypothetical protein
MLFFWFVGGEKALNTTVYPVTGACLPVSRCQLQVTQLSEDEASGAAYQDLQEKDQWWLSYMQTVDCIMLLSCQTLSGKQFIFKWLF